LVDLPRGALGKSGKIVPLSRALSANLKNMVDLPRARARAHGKGASFAEGLRPGSRQRAYSK